MICRSCSRSLLLTAEQAAGACLLCSPVLVAAHRRREVQSEPVEGPAGDPEHGGSPPADAPVVDQRADTIPAAPPTEPMTDCEDEP
jgi:hypothetical protein